MANPNHDLEAKIVILGAANVGKTTLLHRFLHAAFLPPAAALPTVGASFSTKRLLDPDDPASYIRLQLWDTAGQERFRSLSRLYYRNADAALLCYDITSAASFADMAAWLAELRANAAALVIHVVGTKADVARDDPAARAVPFDDCLRYVAAHLPAPRAPDPPPCHEVSARDGEGVDEVFRVLTRQLLDARARREAADDDVARTPAGLSDDGVDYFGVGAGRGSFRLAGDAAKRRSWYGMGMGMGGVSSPGTPGAGWGEGEAEARGAGGGCSCG